MAREIFQQMSDKKFALNKERLLGFYVIMSELNGGRFDCKPYFGMHTCLECFLSEYALVGVAVPITVFNKGQFENDCMFIRTFV